MFETMALSAEQRTEVQALIDAAKAEIGKEFGKTISSQGKGLGDEIAATRAVVDAAEVLAKAVKDQVAAMEQKGIDVDVQAQLDRAKMVELDSAVTTMKAAAKGTEDSMSKLELQIAQVAEEMRSEKEKTKEVQEKGEPKGEEGRTAKGEETEEAQGTRRTVATEQDPWHQATEGTGAPVSATPPMAPTTATSAPRVAEQYRLDGDKTYELKPRDAKEFWPSQWDGDAKARPFRKLTSDIETYLDVLLPPMDAKGLLQWIAKQDGKTSPENKHEEAARVAGVPTTALKEAMGTLGTMLHKQCSECTKIQHLGKRDGLSIFKMLVHHFSAQSAVDCCTLMGRITNPPRASNINELASRLEKWDDMVTEFELKFDNAILTDQMKMTGMLHILPLKVVEDKVHGCHRNTYGHLRDLADDITADMRHFGSMSKKGGELDAIRRGELNEVTKDDQGSEDGGKGIADYNK